MRVIGHEYAEIIDGADGVTDTDDYIRGLGGADTIYALDGNDLIYGGEGADTIYGGDDFDTASYTDSAVGVTVSLITGRGFNGTAQGDRLHSIEGLTGSGHADLLIGNDGENGLNGYFGDDVLNGGGGIDHLWGGNDNDILKGGGGADTLDGGHGSDTSDYSEATSWVWVDLGWGVGRLMGEGGWWSADFIEEDTLINIENVTGSSYGDILGGTDYPNTLKGRDGADLLFGGGGVDRLYGENGNDTLKGGGGADLLDGGDGTDTISYSQSPSGVAVLFAAGRGYWGDAEGDTFAGIENITGSNFADILGGNAWPNVLEGGGGDDVLDGAGGSDTMYGDGGYSEFSLFTEGEGGNDTFNVDSPFDWIFDSSSSTVETVRTSVSYRLPASADVEMFETTNAAGTGPINLTGNDGSQQITGNSGANVLTGLGGNDVFAFKTMLNVINVDTITDFDPAGEYIYLDDAIFSNLGAEPDHFILSTEFQTGTAAGDSDDRIIYDDTTGAIFYDSDGTGAVAQVQFATVTAGLSLAHDNFHVF
jgi:Ca2+-binding RTX toxin-like protein